MASNPNDVEGSDVCGSRSKGGSRQSVGRSRSKEIEGTVAYGRVCVAVSGDGAGPGQGARQVGQWVTLF